MGARPGPRPASARRRRGAHLGQCRAVSSTWLSPTVVSTISTCMPSNRAQKRSDSSRRRSGVQGRRPSGSNCPTAPAKSRCISRRGQIVRRLGASVEDQRPLAMRTGGRDPQSVAVDLRVLPRGSSVPRGLSRFSRAVRPAAHAIPGGGALSEHTAPHAACQASSSAPISATAGSASPRVPATARTPSVAATNASRASAGRLCAQTVLSKRRKAATPTGMGSTR